MKKYVNNVTKSVYKQHCYHLVVRTRNLLPCFWQLETEFELTERLFWLSFCLSLQGNTKKITCNLFFFRRWGGETLTKAYLVCFCILTCPASFLLSVLLLHLYSYWRVLSTTRHYTWCICMLKRLTLGIHTVIRSFSVSLLVWRGSCVAYKKSVLQWCILTSALFNTGVFLSRLKLQILWTAVFLLARDCLDKINASCFWWSQSDGQHVSPTLFVQSAQFVFLASVFTALCNISF